MTIIKKLNKLSITLLCMLCIPLSFAGGNTVEDIDIPLPIQYKDIEITFNKSDINEIIYSPLDNGSLYILNSYYGNLTLSSSTYESLITIAKLFFMSYGDFSELPGLLLSKSFSAKNQETINKVFQISGPEDVTIQQLDKLTVLVLRKTDDTINILIVNPHDNDVYYVLRGVANLDEANELITKIVRIY